jgi:hypothetical protein
VTALAASPAIGGRALPVELRLALHVGSQVMPHLAFSSGVEGVCHSPTISRLAASSDIACFALSLVLCGDDPVGSET